MAGEQHGGGGSRGATRFPDEDERRRDRDRRSHERRLVEDLMFIADELTEALQLRDRELTCPRHGSRRIPKVCPVCALVAVRVKPTHYTRGKL